MDNLKYSLKVLKFKIRNVYYKYNLYYYIKYLRNKKLDKKLKEVNDVKYIKNIMQSVASYYE